MPTPQVRRSTLPLLLVLLLAGTLVGGCARVRTALAVQPDDTVIGEIVVATPEQGPDDPGPDITLPPELEDRVDVAEYRQEGYAGSLLRFSGLTFDELPRLMALAGSGVGPARIGLQRAGNRVLLTGSVDLTTVPVDRADFQLRINFPGQVLESDGDDADAGFVGWTFVPGEATDVSAVVAYDDPRAPSALNWTLGLAAAVALAAATVALLARLTRNPPLNRPIR